MEIGIDKKNILFVLIYIIIFCYLNNILLYYIIFFFTCIIRRHEGLFSRSRRSSRYPLGNTIDEY